MLKKNLLVVESPLQLLNAYEAINYFELDNYKLVIRLSSSEKNNQQIARLVTILDFDKNAVEYVSINEFNRTFLDLIKLAWYRIRFIPSAWSINRVFIGNYSSGFLSLIRAQFIKRKIILLDDGSSTIEIQKGFSSAFYYDIFSMYEIEPYNGQNVYLNSYSRTKASPKENLILDSESVLFLGSGLAEINIVSTSEYIQLMSKVEKIYAKNNKRVLYIPHRSEEREKLEIIEGFSNFSILNIDYPVELFGVFNARMPSVVSSFYSTALLTMRDIYAIEPHAFIFDYKGSEHEKAIDDIYIYYRDKAKIFDLTKEHN